MVATHSTMQQLGSSAPDFSLPDTRGALVALKVLPRCPALLIAFICNHCPYVVHIRDAFTEFARSFGPRGLTVLAISSNDVATHPADSPERMAELAESSGFTFPYLFDETQSVAKAYGAVCTPDFFLYDGDRKLVYRGQFDDSRPGNDRPVNGDDLRRAVEALLAGKPISPDQKPSVGCSIKWKPGNAPST